MEVIVVRAAANHAEASEDTSPKEGACETADTTENSATEETPNAARPKKLFMKQSYRQEWEKMPEFCQWVVQDPNDRFSAWCRICQCKIQARIATLKKHLSTDKHRTSMAENFAIVQLNEDSEITSHRWQSDDSEYYRQHREDKPAKRSINMEFVRACPCSVGNNAHKELNEFDAVGANLASKLRRMSPTQAIYAEQLMSKVAAKGLLNALNENVDFAENVYMLQPVSATATTSTSPATIVDNTEYAADHCS